MTTKLTDRARYEVLCDRLSQLEDVWERLMAKHDPLMLRVARAGAHAMPGLPEPPDAPADGTVTDGEWAVLEERTRVAAVASAILEDRLRKRGLIAAVPS